MSGAASLPPTGREFAAIAAHTRGAYLRYSFTKGTEQEVAFLVDALGLAPGMRVLDVGCGPGRHVRALQARGMTVVGLDLSRPFLEVAGPGRWVQADARALPVAPGSFDAAVTLCQGGFGLLGPPGDAAVVAGMARAVRPGGRVAFSAFSSYFVVRHLEPTDAFDPGTGVNRETVTVRDEEGSHATFDLWTSCFTPQELRWLCAAAGLDVVGLWSVAPGDYRALPPDLDHPEWLVVAGVGRDGARSPRV